MHQLLHVQFFSYKLFLILKKYLYILELFCLKVFPEYCQFFQFYSRIWIIGNYFYEAIWNEVSILTILVQLQRMFYSPFLQFWNPRKCHSGNCKLSLMYFFSDDAVIIISGLWHTYYQKIYKFAINFSVIFSFMFNIGSKF